MRSRRQDDTHYFNPDSFLLLELTRKLSLCRNYFEIDKKRHTNLQVSFVDGITLFLYKV